MPDFETNIPKSRFEQALIPLLRSPMPIHHTEDPKRYSKEFQNNPTWLILIPMEGVSHIQALRETEKPEIINQNELSALIASPNSQLRWLAEPLRSLKFRLGNGRLAITLRNGSNSAHFDIECHEGSKTHKSIVSFLLAAIDSGKQVDQLSKLKAENLLKVALIEMVKYVASEQPEVLLPSGKRKTYIEFMQFLDRNFDRQINSSELADVFGKSPQYLSKVTQYMRGMSLNKFTQFVRLERSREFLKEHSVTQSAKMAGFKESNHFIQIFKKQFGVTPKQSKAKLAASLPLKEAVEFHETFDLKLIDAVPHRSYVIRQGEQNRTLLIANQTEDRVHLLWHPDDSPPVELRVIPPFTRVHISSTPGDKLSVSTRLKSDTFEMHNFNSIFVVSKL